MPAPRGHWYQEGNRPPTLGIIRLRSKSGSRDTLTQVNRRVLWIGGLSWTPTDVFLDCAIAVRTNGGWNPNLLCKPSPVPTQGCICTDKSPFSHSYTGARLAAVALGLPLGSLDSLGAETSAHWGRRSLKQAQSWSHSSLYP